MPVDEFEPEYDLEEDYPGLRGSEWQVTSERTRQYNCISYAAYDTRRPWFPWKHFYWPPGAKKEDTIEGWVSAFHVLAYKPCDDESLEDGYEKIAIYALDGLPKHVARQLESGNWTSKLGNDEDISHHTLEALEGEFYGKVVVLMKRQRMT